MEPREKTIGLSFCWYMGAEYCKKPVSISTTWIEPSLKRSAICLLTESNETESTDCFLGSE